MKKKVINYGGQAISKKDISLVSKSLKKDLITTGPFVKKFESSLEKYLNSKYVTVCNSGTAALHLAFISLGIKRGDVVLMPTITFQSCYNMLKEREANVFLVDIDAKSGQITPEEILKCIKQNKIKKVKCIVTMYLGGYPRRVKDFYKLKKKLKCFLVEDACHAFGATYRVVNKIYKIGSCQHSDIACFSFHPLKTITTGEGGAVSTNIRSISRKTKIYRTHGLEILKHWNYVSHGIGYNYRLSDINCALGLSQLKNIKDILTKRKKIFYKYKDFFLKISNITNKKIEFLLPESKTNPSYNLFVLKLEKNFNIHKVIEHFLKKSIRLQIHYKPIYKFNNFKKINKKMEFLNSEKYYNCAISIPIHPSLTNKEFKYVCDQFKIFFTANNKLLYK